MVNFGIYSFSSNNNKVLKGSYIVRQFKGPNYASIVTNVFPITVVYLIDGYPSTETLSDGSIIYIEDTQTHEIIFTGKISSHQLNDDKKTYTISIKEQLDDINNIFVKDATGLKSVSIINSGSDTLGTYVSTILANSGWADATASTITQVPNTTNAFPSFRFVNTTVGKALEKLLNTLCGYQFWDATGSDGVKKIGYGELRTDRSSTALTGISSVVQDSSSVALQPVDRVIVVGNVTDPSKSSYIQGQAGSTDLDAIEIMYQYTDVPDDETEAAATLQMLADRIYEERNGYSTRYDLDVYHSNIHLREGDKIKISGDYLLSSNDITTIIRDVKIEQDNIHVGCGIDRDSVFDIYGDSLTIVSGVISGGVEINNSLGWRTVKECNISSPSWTDGTAAYWTFTLDTDNISSENITVNLSFDNIKNMLAILADTTGNYNLDGINEANNDDENVDSPSIDDQSVYSLGNNSIPTKIKTSEYLNDSLGIVLTSISPGETLFTTSDISGIDAITNGQGFLTFTLSGGVSDYAHLRLRLEYSTDGGSNWYTAHSSYVDTYYPANIVATTLFVPFPITTNVSGFTNIRFRAKCFIVSGSGTITVLASYLDISLEGEHNHELSYASESYAFSDVAHSTGMTTPSIGVDQADPAHLHDIDLSGTDVGSYPSGVYIYLQTSAYPVSKGGPYTGGGAGIVSLEIATSDLNNGTNILWVVSESIGAINAEITYLSFTE